MFQGVNLSAAISTVKFHIKPLLNYFKNLKINRERCAIEFVDRSITAKLAIENWIENRQILSDRDRESLRRDRTANLHIILHCEVK